MSCGLKIFIALFCGIPIVFIAVGSATAIQQDREIRSAVPVEAVVVSHDIEETSTTSDSKGRRSTNYMPVITYRYSVDGVEHESSNLSPGAFSMAGSYEWAQSELEKYPVGSTTTAYYNPEEPGSAFLVAKHDFGPYLFILFPMIHLAVGIGVSLAFGGKTATAQPQMRSGGWHELVPRSSIGRKLRTWALMAGVWYAVGFFAVGHYFTVASAPYDSIAYWVPAIYGAVGLVPLIFAIYYFRLRQNVSDARVLIDRPVLRPGEPFTIRIDQTLTGDIAIEEMKVGLICDETYRYREGGKTKTSTRELYSDWHDSEKSSTPQRGMQLSAELQFRTPVDQPCSSPAGARSMPRHAWRIAIRTKIANCPDYGADFPVLVTADAPMALPNAPFPSTATSY